MAIHLDINPKQLKRHVEVHYLPAEIETDTEANVNEYFNIYTRNENANLTNSLRGFPLNGMGFEVPLNLKGVVLQESQRSLDECFGRIFRVTGSFEYFTYWNYDKITSAAGGLGQALEVLLVMDELSKPISAEDIKTELDQKLKAAKIKDNE